MAEETTRVSVVWLGQEEPPPWVSVSVAGVRRQIEVGAGAEMTEAEARAVIEVFGGPARYGLTEPAG